MIVDFHCHLDLYPDPYIVARQCQKQDLYVLSVTTTPKAWNGTLKLAGNNEKIRTALGLHPQLAHQRQQELGLFDDLLTQVKYVGEIGLDGSKNFKPYWQEQLAVFRHILRSIHRHGGRIMSIHSRGSVKSTLEELAGIDGVPVLHWFTGNKTELRQAIDQGCWFSVGPAMLATKRGKELVAEIPQQKIITESDGPFAKWKHQPLHPWDVEKSFALLTDIWGVPQTEVKSRLANNFRLLLSMSTC